MRWIALILLVAVIAAAAVLYGMVTGGGEADRPQTFTEVPLPDAEKQAGRPAPDWTAELQRLDPPEAAPTVEFSDGEGNSMTLADFRGQGVVVNLWATWCGPCVHEMPSLNRLQAAVEADGIRVVAVSSDREGMDKVEPFLAEHELDRLAPYLDPQGAFTRSLNGRVLPSTYILNREGEIVAQYIGPAEWDAPELVEAVRELTR